MDRRFRSDLTRRAALALGVAAALSRTASAAGQTLVFAAASLKPPLDEIAAGWNGNVALGYGGSGALARQVAAGAPADVVILAASDWMDWLAEQGVLDGPLVTVARNALVLAGPAGAPPLDLTAPALLDRLGGGRLAMGDPVSVPAGRYARQALESLGLWDAVLPRALYAEDVRAALAYVARRDVPLGIVYASDTVGTAVSRVAILPDDSHDPIVYPGAVVRGAAPGAAAFLDHIVARRDVFAAHGFAR